MRLEEAFFRMTEQADEHNKKKFQDIIFLSASWLYYEYRAFFQAFAVAFDSEY